MSIFALSLVGLLTVVGNAASQQGARGELAVALKGAKEVEVERVPLACRYRLVADGGAPTMNRIHERLAGLVAGRWRFKGEGKLEIDENGLGQVWKPVPASKPLEAELLIDGARWPLLFWREDGEWFVASAALLQGTLQGSVLQSYDADLDGQHGGAQDWMRLGSGSFYLCGAERLAQVGETLFALSFESSEKSSRVLAARVETPESVPLSVALALSELNRWRMQAGFAPMRVNVERTQSLLKHAAYVNMPGNDGDLQKEDPAKPGYSAEGDAAARNSNTLAPTVEPIEAIRPSFTTNYNRYSFLCDPDAGFAAASMRTRNPENHGGRPGYTWLWITGRVGSQLGLPRVQPAPGQTDVALACDSEYPVSGEQPSLFKTRRGTAIGAYFEPRRWSEIQLTLLDPKSRPVKGELFTPARPVCPKAAPDNRDAAFFWPDVPLQPRTRYTVDLRATETTPDGPRSVHLRWSFTTAAS